MCAAALQHLICGVYGGGEAGPLLGPSVAPGAHVPSGQQRCRHMQAVDFCSGGRSAAAAVCSDRCLVIRTGTTLDFWDQFKTTITRMCCNTHVQPTLHAGPVTT